MTEPKTLIPSASDEHLSAETLYQYLEGHLPPEAAHAAERHLLDCDLCTEAMEGLATVAPDSARHALFDLNRTIKSRSLKRKQRRLIGDIKSWGLAAAILFLLLFSAVAVWYHTRITQPPVSPGPTTAGYRPPAPVTGHQAYQDYLRTHQQLPAVRSGQQTRGQVKLQFMVNPDSSLSDIEVLSAPSQALQQEAIRLLQQGPQWQPAEESGQPIRARAMLEIDFHLPE
jgi:hypothetical protein